MVYNTIFINGEPFNCCPSMSLKKLLIYLNFDIDLVVVEYNRELLTCKNFDNIFLNAKDCIEIITIVGGG